MDKKNSMKNAGEGNIAIAEFMGVHITPPGLRRNVMVKSHYLIELKYHTSWDWLMPVVEKIESLGYEVVITETDCYVIVEKEPIYKAYESNLETKIASTYNLCLSFIKYYNDGK